MTTEILNTTPKKIYSPREAVRAHNYLSFIKLLNKPDKALFLKYFAALKTGKNLPTKHEAIDMYHLIALAQQLAKEEGKDIS